MELTEQGVSRRRLIEVTAVAVVLAVVSTIVAVAQLVAGSGPSGTYSKEGETRTTSIESYRVSTDGDATLCMDLGGGEEVSSCGSPIVLEDSTATLADGETVRVTELWVGPESGLSRLTWLVH